MASWSDRLAHKFPSYGGIKEYAAKFEGEPAEPDEVFEAGKALLGMVKELAVENVKLMYASGYADAEEEGVAIDEDKAGELAHKRSIDRFADMCDAAKDRAKYKDVI